MPLIYRHYYSVRAQKPRQIAAEVLIEGARSEEYVETRLDKRLSEAGVGKADRGLCQQLVYGVLRWERTLDWLIQRKCPRPPEKPLVSVLLRLGLFQMFWLDRIPDHASVNESVEMAKNMGLRSQAGFVNAILRGYAREREQTKALLAALKVERPGLGSSHPDWLCDRWLTRWGAAQMGRLLEWNNTPAPIFARVNTLKTTSAQITQAWTGEGVSWSEVARDWFPGGLVYELQSHPSLADLPSFREGHFYVQDPSTLLSVFELDPKPGQSILDLCAAPGGKTTFAAQLMGNQGRILACDKDTSRLGLLRENCARLGVTCVDPVDTSERIVPDLKFDAALVDAPCSNTGVLRRRIEARWRLTPEEMQELAQFQASLLAAAASQVRPGGKLVYSTCSIETEENEQVVSQFLEENKGWRLLRQRTLLPFQDEVDGAFVAVIAAP